MIGASFDWRITPAQLEERDSYFSQLVVQTERMVAADPSKRPAVLVGATRTHTFFFAICLHDLFVCCSLPRSPLIVEFGVNLALGVLRVVNQQVSAWAPGLPSTSCTTASAITAAIGSKQTLIILLLWEVLS